MQRDLKIGMLLGLALIVIGPFWLVFRSSPRSFLPTERRGAPQTTSDLPIRDNNQLSTINDQTKKAVFTTYQPRPASFDFAQDALSKVERALGGVKTLPAVQYSGQAGQRIHIVSKGETLSAISAKYYGSTNKWKKIFDANRSRIKDANKLIPGIKLFIPD